LRDQQHTASRFRNAAIHSSGVVGKHPIRKQPVQHSISSRGIVAHVHAQKYQQPAIDRSYASTLYIYARSAHALQQSFHDPVVI
jgi:hypothetical protein